MSFKAEYIVLFDRLQIRYYGIIIVAAMLVGAWVAARLAKRDGRDPDHIWGALTWAIIPAIVLARAWFVVFPPASVADQGMDFSWFMQHFFDLQNGAIAIWSGGLSIFGAVIGGAIGAWLYMSRWHGTVAFVLSAFFFIILYPIILIIAVVRYVLGKRLTPFRFPSVRNLDRSLPPGFPLPFAPWMDIAAVALPLGQAIGRWANFVNQELYGTVTTLPWGIPIDRAHRVGEYVNLVVYPTDNPVTRFHPLFLYESLWNVLAFIILLNLFLRNRNKLRYGDIFLIYVMQYSFIRFLLEFLRVEVAHIPGTTINSSQAMTAIAFIAAFAAYLYRSRTAPTVEEVEKQQPVPTSGKTSSKAA